MLPRSLLYLCGQPFLLCYFFYTVVPKPRCDKSKKVCCGGMFSWINVSCNWMTTVFYFLYYWMNSITVSILNVNNICNNPSLKKTWNIKTYLLVFTSQPLEAQFAKLWRELNPDLCRLWGILGILNYLLPNASHQTSSILLHDKSVVVSFLTC